MSEYKPKFKDIDELLLHIVKIQTKYNIDNKNKYGSRKGIMEQLFQFNIPPEMRDKEEVAVFYFNELEKVDPKEPDVYLEVQVCWFNKTTSKSLDEVPQWFIDKKTKMTESQIPN